MMTTIAANDLEWDAVKTASSDIHLRTCPTITIASVIELGDVRSLNTQVRRDLGFPGQIGHHVILTYGDTMFGDSEDEPFRGMTCNSVALASPNPCFVYDPTLDGRGFPCCFLSPSEKWGEEPCEYALGLTNVIETHQDCGVVFFLLNHRPEGQNKLLGAGVAQVHLNQSTQPPTPVARRCNRYMWNGEQEPWFGDVCALRSGEYIYAYGHVKDNPWIYVARVRWQQVEDIGAYEYWHGKVVGWSRKQLTRDEVNEEQAVFWQVQQGQAVYSKYHNQYLFVYADNFWSCQILMKTASLPEGPWSEPTTIYRPSPIQEGGNVYSPLPHTYFDPSGKTLVITFTNHPNQIQAIRVVFDRQESPNIDSSLQVGQNPLLPEPNSADMSDVG